MSMMQISIFSCLGRVCLFTKSTPTKKSILHICIVGTLWPSAARQKITQNNTIQNSKEPGDLHVRRNAEPISAISSIT